MQSRNLCMQRHMWKSLPTHLAVCSVQNKEVMPTLHGDLQSTHSKPSLLQGSS